MIIREKNLDGYFQKGTIQRINSWELMLRHKRLAEGTIKRKMNHIQDFWIHIAMQRDTNPVNWDNVNDVLFTYLRDGLFADNNEENYGCFGHRKNIHYDIKESFEWICEPYKSVESYQPIYDLTNSQLHILETISKNKYYKTINNQIFGGKVQDGLQVKLMKDLGIKVYFDKDDKPYVLSHELAELISKNHKNTMRDVRKIIEKLQELKIEPLQKSLDISMVEDTYSYNTNNGGTKEVATYRLSKDLVIHYVLGLNGEKYSTFKFEYQAAFNYIEQEYMKILKKYAEVKKAFIDSYNKMSKENMLMLNGHETLNKRKRLK